MDRRRQGLWVAVALAFGGFLYSLAGALQAAWLSATPDYPVERATKNFYWWGAGSFVMLCFLVLLAVVLFKTRTRRA